MRQPERVPGKLSKSTEMTLELMEKGWLVERRLDTGEFWLVHEGDVRERSSSTVFLSLSRMRKLQLLERYPGLYERYQLKPEPDVTR